MVSFRAELAKLNSAFAGQGVVVKLSESLSGTVSSTIEKAKKDVAKRTKEDLKKAVREVQKDANESLRSLLFAVQSRYSRGDVPDYDAFTGRSFNRGSFSNRSGNTRRAKINGRVKSINRVTFNKEVESIITITASSVPILEGRQGGGKTKFPELKKAKRPYQNFGNFGDTFSMMEYGFGTMRYDDQPYTTFSGERFNVTKGFFELDRIIKDEYVKLRKDFNRQIVRSIKDAFD